MTYKNKTRLNKKTFLIITTSILVLAGGSVLAWNKLHNKTTTDDPTINYSPPTKDEKEAVEEHKESIVQDNKEAIINSQNSNSGSGIKSVKPTITNDNASLSGGVNAYVSGIFEEGGTCSAIFTKDSTMLTKTSEGFGNVSYTQCAPITIEPGFLSRGSWSVIVNYKSTKAQGSSDARSFEVK